MNGNYSSEEVSENLSSLQIEGVNILKVEMINFSKNAELDPSYIVTLSPDSLIKNLTRRKKILHQIVYWEPLRKNQIFQCKRCQRVGHASANCNLPYRCVKCLDDHQPGQCKRTKDPTNESTVACVNCQKFGHPAIYIGCPYLLYAQNKTNENKNHIREIKEFKIAQKTQYIQENRTHAQSAANYQRPAPIAPQSKQEMGNRYMPPTQPHATTIHYNPSDIFEAQRQQQQSMFENKTADRLAMLFEGFKRQRLDSVFLLNEEMKQDFIKANLAMQKQIDSQAEKINKILEKIQ